MTQFQDDVPDRPRKEHERKSLYPHNSDLSNLWGWGYRIKTWMVEGTLPLSEHSGWIFRADRSAHDALMRFGAQYPVVIQEIIVARQWVEDAFAKWEENKQEVQAARFFDVLEILQRRIETGAKVIAERELPNAILQSEGHHSASSLFERATRTDPPSPLAKFFDWFEPKNLRLEGESIFSAWHRKRVGHPPPSTYPDNELGRVMALRSWVRSLLRVFVHDIEFESPLKVGPVYLAPSDWKPTFGDRASLAAVLCDFRDVEARILLKDATVPLPSLPHLSDEVNRADYLGTLNELLRWADSVERIATLEYRVADNPKQPAPIGTREASAMRIPQEFEAARTFAANKLKGDERRTIEEVINFGTWASDGSFVELDLGSLATTLEKTPPFDDAFNSLFRRLKSKLKSESSLRVSINRQDGKARISCRK